MEEVHPAGLYLLAKISLQSKKPNAPEILYNFLNSQECSFEMFVIKTKNNNIS
jgi:hypothetical protein